MPVWQKKGRLIGNQIVSLYLETATASDAQADLVEAGKALLRGDGEQSSEHLADISSHMIEFLAVRLSQEMGRLPPRRGGASYGTG